MKINRIVGLVIAISFSACDLIEEIDYNTIYDTEKIVVNGFISNDNGVTVIVKKTVAPNAPNNNDSIDSPWVTLICNEKEVAQLSKTKGNKYTLASDFQYEDGAIYKIKVEASGLQTVISDGQQLVVKTLVDTAYNVHDTINWAIFTYIEFDDNPLEKNYYTYKVEYYNAGIVESVYKYVLPLWCFTDEGFLSQDHRVVKYDQITSLNFDSAKVSLYTVPEFYYDFIQSYSDYEISNQNYYYETIYPVLTNIENGFGFFCSYEVDEYIFKNDFKKIYYE